MIRRIITIVGTVLILAGLYFFAVRFNWLPSPSRLFQPAPVFIDETPLMVSKINQLHQLVTITSLDEVVVSSIKPSPVGAASQLLKLVTAGHTPSIDRLVLVVKGSVLVGTDLKLISASQVFVQADSVSLKLPPANILQVIANPSGTETFIEEGSWSPQEVQTLKEKAVNDLQTRALAKGLLRRADEQSLQVMQQFLKALGYRKIRIAIGN